MSDVRHRFAGIAQQVIWNLPKDGVNQTVHLWALRSKHSNGARPLWDVKPEKEMLVGPKLEEWRSTKAAHGEGTFYEEEYAVNIRITKEATHAD